jgi:CDGSH-type Zn-finger protein
MSTRRITKNINQNNLKQITMKNILLILLFATGLLLTSCGKSSHKPPCEEDGTEVTP